MGMSEERMSDDYPSSDVISLDGDLMEGSDNETVVDIKEDANRVISSHREEVMAVAYDPGCRFLASAAMDNLLQIHKCDTGELAYEAPAFQDTVTHLAFNYSGQMLAAGDMAGNVGVWCLGGESQEWQPLVSFKTADDLSWLDWFQPTNCADCRTGALMAGDASGLVTIWPVSPHRESEKPAKYLVGFGSPSVAAYSFPDRSRPHLAVLYEENTLKVWSLATDSVVCTFSLSAKPSSAPVDGEMELEDQKMIRLEAPPPGHSHEGLLALGSNNGTILLAPCTQAALANAPEKVPASQLTRHEIRDHSSVEGLGYCASHPYLAYATISGVIGLFDVSLMRVRNEWVYDAEGSDLGGVGVTCLKWSRKQPVFFTATLLNTVVAWPGLMLSERGDAPAPLAVLHGHADTITDLELRPLVEPGQLMETELATASEDATIRFFPIDAQELTKDLIR